LRLSRQLLLISYVVLLFANITQGIYFAVAVDYTRSFSLVGPDSARYELTVAIPSSLLEYYKSKDHVAHSKSDYGKFVTPYAVAPIASNLRSTYGSDESFANAVLMITHQLSYAQRLAVYPVETLVDGWGDCDCFSYLAASIMKAGGLDVMLLLYEAKEHMNVGVYLTKPPSQARTSSSYFYQYGGKEYYVAETTGDPAKWQVGWRVGEMPENLRGLQAYVIEPTGGEKGYPTQVSARIDKLPRSITLTLTLSVATVSEGGQLVLQGSVTPPVQNVHVTLYASSDGSTWTFLATVTTDSQGSFIYTWVAQKTGKYFFKAFLPGDLSNIESSSPVQALMVEPLFQVVFRNVLLGAILVASSLPIIAFALLRKGNPSTSPLRPRLAYRCPFCNGHLGYSREYQRWYCYNCQRYL